MYILLTGTQNILEISHMTCHKTRSDTVNLKPETTPSIPSENKAIKLEVNNNLLDNMQTYGDWANFEPPMGYK